MNALTEYEKPKTLVLGKMAEINKEKVKAQNALQNAKDRAVYARNAYENTSKWHFIKRKKRKQEYRRAMDDLTIAQSEATIQQFKIIGYVIELVLLGFLIPLDGIQKLAQWCASGFEERDSRFSSFVRKITPFFTKNAQDRTK